MLIQPIQAVNALFVEKYIMQKIDPINANVDSTLIEICLEQETSVTQLSLLVTDKLHRELYVLPYDG